MGRDFLTDIGFIQAGTFQACIYRRYVSDGVISVGDILMASSSTDGRAMRASAGGAPVIGIALDAAAGAGTTIRVAFVGVCPVNVASATAVTRGDSLGTNNVGNGIQMANIGVSTPKTLVGIALESSASGSLRLVDTLLMLHRQVGVTSAAPVATTPGTASADGVATTVATSDHAHQSPGGIASLTADAAIANTETVVVSASIAAGFLKVGTTLRVRAFGIITTGATGGTSSFRCRIGPVTKTGPVVALVAPVNANSVNSAPWELEFLITIRTVGATGATASFSLVKAQTAAPIAFTSKDSLNIGTSPTVDTTAANLIELTYISGNAGSTATFKVAEIEVVKM